MKEERFEGFMQASSNSLAVTTLAKMGVRIAVVVCIVTGATYAHLRHTLREEAQRQLLAYCEQRISRERLPFELAAQNGNRFRTDYLRRLSLPAPSDFEERFTKFAHPRGDGTLRNAEKPFDPNTMVGLFVGPQQTVDAAFRRRVVLAAEMIDVLGPEMTSILPDFYMTMPDNVMIIYWAGVPWTSNMAPDFDMRKEPYLTVASHELNPRGEQAWTPIYYDSVGGVWMMSFATPIYIDGQHVASIEQDLLLDDFLKRTAAQSLAGAHNVIVRVDGTIIYAPGLDADIIKANGALRVEDTGSAELAAILAAARREGHETKVVDEGKSLLGLAFIPGPDWFFITVYPKSLISSRAMSAARVIFGLGVVSLAAELLVLFLVLRGQVARPLKRLTQATDRVAAGELGVQINVDREDELGQLARAFNAMTTAMNARDAELEQHATNMESMVAKRTAELDGRNREMRTVLDRVEDGLVTLDRTSAMAGECSAALERWFGPTRPGLGFAEYLSLHDPQFAAAFSVAFEQLLDGVLSVEVAVAQLPRTIHYGERTIQVAYLPILTDNQLTQLVVVMKDMTAQIARAQAESEQRSFAQIVEHLFQDRQGLIDFFADSCKIVQLLTENPTRDVTVEARMLHTLNGNSGCFGLHGFAELCRELEDRLSSTGEFAVADRELLRKNWEKLAVKVRRFVGDERKDLIEISRAKIFDLATLARAAIPDPSVADSIESWALDPVEARLSHLGDYARSLAERLGKPNLRVEVVSRNLHVDGELWSPFWAAMVHAVRNMVDHGIELPGARAAKGKTEPGCVVLTARLVDDTFVVTLADDGAGVDWTAVARRARALGLPASTRVDLENALFVDGLSTRDEITETSGRGVGLAALKAEVERRGGRIVLQSEAGIGTRWDFRFPRSAMRPAPPEMHPSTVPRAIARVRSPTV